MSIFQKTRSGSPALYGVMWTALVSLLLPFAVWADDEEGTIEEIIVTGSLIKRDNFDSASPLQVLDDVDIQAEATPALGEIVYNQTFNYGTDVFASHYSVTNPEGNRSSANFRGLGEGATLSLLDGKRVTDSNLNNLIPQIAIARIDILKDGASALYGSDAVAGVINVIPKKNVEGAEVGMFYTMDSEGDHSEYVANFVIGDTTDRGYFTFATEIREKTPLYQTERPNITNNSVSSSGTGNPGRYNVPIRGADGSITGTETLVDPGCGVAASPGGNGALQRYDHRTRQMQLINVWPEEATGFAPRDLKYRFAWTFPILFSPHDSGTLYVGGNHVFRSYDEGMSWDCISPDLSRNDIEKLDFSGGPLNHDSAGAEQYASCASVVESIHRKGELWASTDDGLVHVTRDGGLNWENVTPKDMPEWAYVGNVEVSCHDPDTVYLSATRFKLSDYKPYLFVTRDSGKTWLSISTNFPQTEITRVIRSDTEKAGLLFVGTETGIYVSSNDGEIWNRIESNFPVVPVYDLKIKETDLVVATHGRSFWILDDITPLRDQNFSSEVIKLYSPRITVRQNIHWSAGLFNGDGKDYSPAFGVQGASYLTDTPDGRKKRRYLDTGENPPLGAIIYYWLGKVTSKSKIKIVIKDESGATVACCESQNEKASNSRRPTCKEGLNRFVWDLTEDPPIKLDEGLKTRKYEPFAKSEGGPAGAKVQPGNYLVVLTANGESQEAKFSVVKDPRVNTSQEDFEVQNSLYKEITTKLSDLNIAVNRIRLMKSQLKNIDKIIPDEAETAGLLVDELERLEGQLVDIKRETPRDVLRHPAGLDDTLQDLLWVVKIADANPPAQSHEVAQDVFNKVDKILGDLDELVDNKISEFNSTIAKASPPAVSGSSIGASKTGW